MATRVENHGGTAALEWLHRITDALEGDRFELHAQPIVELATGSVVHRELLLRMRENGSTVVAGEFVPVAERHGRMRELDGWVLRSALDLCERGHRVTVNLSGESISLEFAGEVKAGLAKRNVEPSSLALEVTEPQLIEDASSGAEFVRAIDALGCKLAVAMDSGRGGLIDFYAPPFSYLKIDGPRVRGLKAGGHEEIQSIVQLAKRFDARTIAEQVEDVATLQLLEEIGVDEAQGFALGYPEPVEA